MCRSEVEAFKAGVRRGESESRGCVCARVFVEEEDPEPRSLNCDFHHHSIGQERDCNRLGRSQNRAHLLPGAICQSRQSISMCLASALFAPPLFPPARILEPTMLLPPAAPQLKQTLSSVPFPRPDPDPGRRRRWKTQSLPCRSSPTLEKTVLGAGSQIYDPAHRTDWRGRIGAGYGGSLPGSATISLPSTPASSPTAVSGTSSAQKSCAWISPVPESVLTHCVYIELARLLNSHSASSPTLRQVSSAK